MPFIEPLPYDELPNDIQRIFDGVEKQQGFVFGNWPIMAHAPHIFKGFRQFIYAVLNPNVVEKRTVELAILQTSLLNRCRY